MSRKDKHLSPSIQSSESHANIEKRETILRSVYQETQTFERPREKPSLIPLALLAVLIGLMSGFLSVVLVTSGSLERVPYLRHLDMRLLLSNTPIIIERTEKVTVTANERSEALLKRVQPMLYGIFETSALTLNTEGLVRSLQPPLGTGVAVTSDGWLITGYAFGSKPGDYIVLNRDGEMFPVTAIVVDPATEFRYFHIQASGLAVASFLREAALSLTGSEMIVPQFRVGLTAVPFTNTTAALFTPPVRASDAFLTRIRLTQSLTDGTVGSPVMILSGEVVGIVMNPSEQGAAVATPTWYIGTTLDQIAKNGTIVRPRFGAHYLELSSAARLKFPALGGRQSGALLMGGGDKTEAVEPRSNAALAGLKAGDIITKVDDELVNDITDLTFLIQSYKPDVKASILFIRDGEEKITEVSLAPPVAREQKSNTKNVPAKKK